MLKLELRAEKPNRPGFAQLVIHNWSGDDENVTLSIQRNQDQRFLDDNNQWLSGEILHPLAVLHEEGDSLWAGVGPQLVDPLLAESNVAYRLKLSDGSTTDFGVLRLASDLLSSLAGSAKPEPVPEIAPELKPEAAPESTPEAEIVPPRVEEVVPPPPTPAKKEKSLLWPLLTLVVLLAAGGAAAWFFLKKPAEPIPPPPPPASSTPAPTTTPAGCAPAALKSLGEMDFVKGCLSTQPSSIQVIEIIKQAKEQKLCAIAQRLYAYKAQAGDNIIALSYAHEYDPQTNLAGGCFKVDIETAVYWYERVIAQDPQNADAQARLKSLKK